MGYLNYNVEDFLADESFQQYCSGTDEEAIQHWNKILQEQPEIDVRFKEAVEWYNILNAGQGNLKKEANRLVARIENEKEVAEESVAVKPFLKTWWAAAVIFLLVAAGSFLLLNKKAGKELAVETDKTKKPEGDIAPGGNKAVLTLADGSQIVLDTTTNGAITEQGGVTIIKLDGQLAYNKGDSISTEVLFNTITTPKGGQYQLVLADGTKVWLNAASSLRFPTSFPGTERTVDLTGEGYFEVAHNATKPFHVKVNDIDVQVLGTHFNCNAYNDEPLTAITLLEGSVKIKSGVQNIVLKEGQQARAANVKFQSVTPSNTAAVSVINDADIKSVVAWKNGLFDFNNAHITDVMRQLARWYDAEVLFKGKIPERHYTGAIRRSVNLSEVIKMIELAGGVHVTIDNKKIIIQER